MPYTSINIVLQAPLRPEETIPIRYPKGKSQGSFLGAFDHTLAVGTHFFRAPKEFLIEPQAENILFHWRGAHTLTKGSILYLRIHEMGAYFYHHELTGTTVLNTMQAGVFMINLNAPVEETTDYFVSPMRVKSGGVLPMARHEPDVPRTITISSDGDETGHTFRIEGEDMYQRQVIEEITGPEPGSYVEGNKSFTRIHRIIVDQPCNGIIHIGIGRKLGLPVFLPAPGFVLRELVNGDIAPAGEFIPGYVGVPSSTAADRRGLYIPSKGITLNGKTPLHLLLSIPNPGNIGAPDV